MTRLRTLTTLFPDPNQVSDNDAILNSGKGDYYAIFQPGAFPFTRADGTESLFNWEIIFDFYVRYKTRKESLPKFKAARTQIIHDALFRTCLRKIVKGVENVIPSASGGLQQDIPGDNPNFIIQTISVIVTQRITNKV